jgi:hypothetical protein
MPSTMLKANSARLDSPGNQRLLVTMRCNSRLQAHNINTLSETSM